MARTKVPSVKQAADRGGYPIRSSRSGRPVASTSRGNSSHKPPVRLPLGTKRRTCNGPSIPEVAPMPEIASSGSMPSEIGEYFLY